MDAQLIHEIESATAYCTSRQSMHESVSAPLAKDFANSIIQQMTLGAQEATAVLEALKGSAYEAYTDEVTPGNPLAQKNNRKFQAFYWSFLEFGVSALSREEAWFTATTEYSVHVSGLSAGLSQVVGSIFKLFFSDGINLAVTGVLLDFDDHTSVRLWAVLGGMLQDGGAHKAVWHSRGDSASKFCIPCKNLFDQESEIADADDTNLLSCNCLTW